MDTLSCKLRNGDLEDIFQLPIIHEYIRNNLTELDEFSLPNITQYSVAQDEDENILNVAAYSPEVGAFVEVSDDISVRDIRVDDASVGDISVDGVSVSDISVDDVSVDDISDDDVGGDSIDNDDVTVEDTTSVSRECSFSYGNIVPYVIIPDSPFHLFSMDELLKSITVTHNLDNRSVVYYGPYPYKYGKVKHDPKPFTDNPYLMKIMSYTSVVFPDTEFNSALINIYKDGQSFMPAHSDNEDDIEDDSVIITISFGESRSMEFSDRGTGELHNIKLSHGDVTVMTKVSQRYYKHSIPVDTCEGTRISVTIRNIKLPVQSTEMYDHIVQQPNEESLNCSNGTVRNFLLDLQNHDDKVENGYNQHPSDHHDGYQDHPKLPLQYKQNPKKAPQQHIIQNTDRAPYSTQHHLIPTAIYISSSMFRFLDASKLSSPNQNAKVFFYPGADSNDMLTRLCADPEFQNLNKKSVNKVFLLTGSNNVDAMYFGKKGWDYGFNGISKLVKYIKYQFSSEVKINVMNILPRSTKGRSDIITELNLHIKHLCDKYLLNYIDTVSINMFSDSRGNRREEFFSQKCWDNVHLNESGIVRMARHLKYIAYDNKLS